MTYLPHTVINVLALKSSKLVAAHRGAFLRQFRPALDDTSVTWEKDYLAGVSKPGQGRRPVEP
jgi:hypothetical protein